MLREELRIFALCIQFLTRLPFPFSPTYSDAAMSQIPRYFPAVGALIGAIGAVIIVLGHQAFGMLVATLLAVAIGLLVTGALHEDGLADMFDGIGGATTAERALEIMRDSRIGTYGALALFAVLGLKIAALVEMGPALAVPALIVGHAASRLSCTIAMASSRYVRATGAGQALASGVTPASVLIAVGVTALVLPLLPFMAWLPAIFGLTIGHIGARFLYERRLKGFTGDCIGAVQQLSELGIYLSILAWH